ncbi:uncharacterized protein LOC127855145 [Dreissena polymorpha]|uniref:DBF4-type domain-containing protein n=1 Tax=Dreissena polymorpha TaxID=45954 RepID=A0A9D4C2J8_DREPO|nr:uncharacterized protein LOC127855145 [Dreissena polymorpha]XP_052246506.1 uncharacterized protein LOC127855145 [Dreissena polymorpha]XP_052246507.1 uncharacterized protein LOC127855145 [Dreissena polymorpha]XP_052246508.1 uncharacterized protein LOC127855145 [Dreissena polymorpha]KAH3716168.1 hypothetical protein DPMN_058887 [Dreissena polymorpha]
MKKETGAKYKVSPKGKRRLEYKSKSKLKLPLIGRTVYLDVKDAKTLKRLQTDLKTLGATLEEFVSCDINYLITSTPRPKGSQADPYRYGDISPTPSPFNCEPSPSPGNPEEKKVTSVTRGKALLEKARINTRQTSTLLDNAERWGIKIVSLEGAFKWIDKELKKLPKIAHTAKKSSKCISAYKTLKTPFIKCEAECFFYRPFYNEIDNWPRLNTDTPKGSCPFDGTLIKCGDESVEERGELMAAQVDMPSEDTPREEKDTIDSANTAAKPNNDKFVKKSDVDISGNNLILTAGELKRRKAAKRKQERKRGYCECCKLKYEDLDKHVQEDQHRRYVKDKSHYKALDILIDSGPSTSKFLQQILTRAIVQKRELTRNSQVSSSNTKPLETVRRSPRKDAAKSPRKLSASSPNLTAVQSMSKSKQSLSGKENCSPKQMLVQHTQVLVNEDILQHPKELSVNKTSVDIEIKDNVTIISHGSPNKCPQALEEGNGNLRKDETISLSNQSGFNDVRGTEGIERKKITKTRGKSYDNKSANNLTSPQTDNQLSAQEVSSAESCKNLRLSPQNNMGTVKSPLKDRDIVNSPCKHPEVKFTWKGCDIVSPKNLNKLQSMKLDTCSFNKSLNIITNSATSSDLQKEAVTFNQNDNEKDKSDSMKSVNNSNSKSKNKSSKYWTYVVGKVSEQITNKSDLPKELKILQDDSFRVSSNLTEGRMRIRKSINYVRNKIDHLSKKEFLEDADNLNDADTDDQIDKKQSAMAKNIVQSTVGNDCPNDDDNSKKDESNKKILATKSSQSLPTAFNEQKDEAETKEVQIRENNALDDCEQRREKSKNGKFWTYEPVIVTESESKGENIPFELRKLKGVMNLSKVNLHSPRRRRSRFLTNTDSENGDTQEKQSEYSCTKVSVKDTKGTNKENIIEKESVNTMKNTGLNSENDNFEQATEGKQNKPHGKHRNDDAKSSSKSRKQYWCYVPVESDYKDDVEDQNLPKELKGLKGLPEWFCDANSDGGCERRSKMIAKEQIHEDHQNEDKRGDKNIDQSKKEAKVDAVLAKECFEKLISCSSSKIRYEVSTDDFEACFAKAWRGLELPDFKNRSEPSFTFHSKTNSSKQSSVRQEMSSEDEASGKEVDNDEKSRQSAKAMNDNVIDHFVHSDIPSDIQTLNEDGQVLHFTKTLAERIKERPARRSSVQSCNLNQRSRSNSFSSNNSESKRSESSAKPVNSAPKRRSPKLSNLVSPEFVKNITKQKSCSRIASTKIMNKYKTQRQEIMASGYQGDDEVEKTPRVAASKVEKKKMNTLALKDCTVKSGCKDVIVYAETDIKSTLKSKSRKKKQFWEYVPVTVDNVGENDSDNKHLPREIRLLNGVSLSDGESRRKSRLCGITKSVDNLVVDDCTKDDGENVANGGYEKNNGERLALKDCAVKSVNKDAVLDSKTDAQSTSKSISRKKKQFWEYVPVTVDNIDENNSDNKYLPREIRLLNVVSLSDGESRRTSRLCGNKETVNAISVEQKKLELISRTKRVSVDDTDIGKDTVGRRQIVFNYETGESDNQSTKSKTNETKNKSVNEFDSIDIDDENIEKKGNVEPMEKQVDKSCHNRSTRKKKVFWDYEIVEENEEVGLSQKSKHKELQLISDSWNNWSETKSGKRSRSRSKYYGDHEETETEDSDSEILKVVEKSESVKVRRSKSPVFKSSSQTFKPNRVSSPVFNKSPGRKMKETVFRKNDPVEAQDGEISKNENPLGNPERNGRLTPDNSPIVGGAQSSGYSRTPREERKKMWKRKRLESKKKNVENEFKRRKIVSLNSDLRSSPRKKLATDFNCHTLKNLNEASQSSLRWEPIALKESEPEPESTEKVKLNKSWTLLSERSVSKLLSSEDDAESFNGFEEGDTSLPSDLSYNECSEIDVPKEDKEQWDIEDIANDNNEKARSMVQFERLVPPVMSSPWKHSNSSWDEACDSYVDRSLQNLTNSSFRAANSSMYYSFASPRKSPRKDFGFSSPVKSMSDCLAGRVCSETPTKKVAFQNEPKLESRVDEEIVFNFGSPQKNNRVYSPLKNVHGEVLDPSTSPVIQKVTYTPVSIERVPKRAKRSTNF